VGRKAVVKGDAALGILCNVGRCQAVIPIMAHMIAPQGINAKEKDVGKLFTHV
jgi:hypothetical protein